MLAEVPPSGGTSGTVLDVAEQLAAQPEEDVVGHALVADVGGGVAVDAVHDSAVGDAGG